MLIVALGLSVVFETVELGLLEHDDPGYHRLRVAYILKLVLVIPMIAMAIVMVFPSLNYILNI
jgi:hypothetical protein